MEIRKKVLVVYSTRNMDSNLFMASTIFSGLHKCKDISADILFCGTRSSVEFFKSRYSRYFDKCLYIVEKEGWVERFCRRNQKLNRLYTFYRQFVKDAIWRSYSFKLVSKTIRGGYYSRVLSFVPTFEGGRLGWDIAKRVLSNVRYVQFWTDPLSLGRLDYIEEMPFTRFMHRWEESRLLHMADKAIFCYPLLCEMEQKLYPDVASKMSWSDIGYIEHELDSFKPHNEVITIGHFGAYQKRVRNIIPLLAAIKNFPHVRFVLRGDSDVVVDSSGYTNLDVKAGRAPALEVERLEANCDALLCLGGRSGITNPAGKVFYYASYNKPILYIGDGVHNDYFKRYLTKFDRYLICDNTVESITQGLEELIEVIPHFKLAIPDRMRLDVIARKIIES